MQIELEATSETLGPYFFIGAVNVPAFRHRRLPQDGGFWHVEHQCDGTACNQRVLYGLVLPLSTCQDAEIRHALEVAARTFKGFQGDFPIKDLQPALYSAREAFIPIMHVEKAFDWLRRHGFRMHIRRNNGAPGQQSMEAMSLSGIIEELKRRTAISDSSELTIAFVYTNSD